MDILLLQLDAPLMSFGAPIVDRHGVIQPYPALSMITGLIGNALGYDHADFEQLSRLQERVSYASRQDRRGKQIQDYQTVDLSKPYLDDKRAWTTHGELETRKGGSASSGTHIRLRDYWADAIHTVALTLKPEEESPTVDDVEQALIRPARPLFIGRKTCLPASQLVVQQIQADNLVSALQEAPLHTRADQKGNDRYPMWWPVHPDEDERDGENIRKPVTDKRDWSNQIHVGERWIAHGNIEVIAQEVAHD